MGKSLRPPEDAAGVGALLAREISHGVGLTGELQDVHAGAGSIDEVNEPKHGYDVLAHRRFW